MWGINFAERGRKIITKLPTGLPVGYRGYIENYFQIPGRVSYLFCSSSVVISKEVFDQVEYFDERIKYAEDLDMWFRIAATYPLAFYDKTMVWYLLDAENRAMNRPQILNLYLPYFVDKYANYKSNSNFYNWIHRWSAQVIRRYYFSTNMQDVNHARVAIKKLDYSVLPKKYFILYNSKCPYWIARILHKLDQYYHNVR
jgi:GT2 family glycosyltransferase